MSKKTAPGFLRFGSMLFLIFEKGMSKKIAPGMLRFVSMFVFFNISKRDQQQKLCEEF